MARSVLRQLTLTDFRSYAEARLPLDGQPVFLFGENGAGKTNLLEALSFLAPGRGLRGAAAVDAGRRMPEEARGRAWSVSARIEDPHGETRVGTGVELGGSRRIVRIEGEPAPPAGWPSCCGWCG